MEQAFYNILDEGRTTVQHVEIVYGQSVDRFVGSMFFTVMVYIVYSRVSHIRNRFVRNRDIPLR